MVMPKFRDGRKSAAVLTLAVVAILNAGSVGSAQTPSPPSRDCAAAPSGQPATPAAKDAAAGSKNPGATGWSGSGLGGSHTQTANQGPTASSPTAQPETATGLDPTKPTSKQVANAAACGNN